MRCFGPTRQLVTGSTVLIASVLVVINAAETRADPIGFAFGIPSVMTLVQNQAVPIPAAIINAETIALTSSTVRRATHLPALQRCLPVSTSAPKVTTANRFLRSSPD